MGRLQQTRSSGCDETEQDNSRVAIDRRLRPFRRDRSGHHLTGGVDEIVAEGERIENETGASAMTVAGTGDTLLGIIASLLGRGWIAARQPNSAPGSSARLTTNS